jgi:hypothetical protein
MRKPIAEIILGQDGKQAGMMPNVKADVQSQFNEKEQIAKDILKAVDQKDPMMLADAMQAMHECCSMPEDMESEE